MLITTLIGIVSALVTMLAGGTLYLIAGKFAGRPSALYYAEQEVKRLQIQCAEYEKLDRAQAQRIALLEQRTDIVKAIEPLRMLMAEHEHNAKTRSDAVLTVLGSIASLLGPENGMSATVVDG